MKLVDLKKGVLTILYKLQIDYIYTDFDKNQCKIHNIHFPSYAHEYIDIYTLCITRDAENTTNFLRVKATKAVGKHLRR